MGDKLPVGIEGFVLVPIAIRDDATVRIHFPANITPDEAEKVARVIQAYASPTPDKAPSDA